MSWMLAVIAALAAPAAGADCSDAQGRYYGLARQRTLSDSDIRWLVEQLDGPCAQAPVVDDLLRLHDPDGYGGDPEVPLRELALRTLSAAPEAADALAQLLLDPMHLWLHDEVLTALQWGDHPLDARLRSRFLQDLRRRPVDPVHAARAARLLCRTPDSPDQDDAMVGALKHLGDLPAGDTWVEYDRDLAIGAVGVCLHQRTGRLDPAVRALRHRPDVDPHGRLSAASMLAARDPDPRLVPIALDHLDDRNPHAAKAVELLGLLGDAGRPSLLALRPDDGHVRAMRWVALFSHAPSLEPRHPAMVALLAWNDALPDPDDRYYAAAQLRKHAETVGQPAAWQPWLERQLADPTEQVRWWALRAWLHLLPRLPAADQRALIARLDGLLRAGGDDAELVRSGIADVRNSATSLDDARAWVDARR